MKTDNEIKEGGEGMKIVEKDISLALLYKVVMSCH